MVAVRRSGLAVLTALALAVAQAAGAQQVPRPAASKEDPAAAALDAYRSGTKAFEAGKTGPAIAALSTALTSGGLPAQDLARALYYRGMAYRRQGQPAHALSDLMSALWLRGGLSDTDRAGAVAQHRAAYHDAGLGDPAVPQAVSLAATNPAAASSVPALAPAAPAAALAEAVTWGAVVSEAAVTTAMLDPMPARAPAAPIASPPGAPAAPPPAATPAAATTAPPPAVLPWQSAGVPAPAPDVSEAPAAPVADAGTAIGKAGQSAAKFFGALFSGSAATATPEASSPIETAATSPPPAAARPVPAAVAWDADTFGVAPVGEVERTPVSFIAAASAPPPPVAATIPAPVEAPAAATAENWPSPTIAAAPSAVHQSVAPAAAPPLPVATAPDPVPEPRTMAVAVAATPAPVATVPAVPPASSGRYRLQIAATSSRAEAETVAQRLQQKHGLSLRGAEPAIYGPESGAGSLFGSMGPAYRVSLGPYLTAVEPGRLCNILRPHGFDCQVVTQEADAAGN